VANSPNPSSIHPSSGGLRRAARFPGDADSRLTVRLARDVTDFVSLGGFPKAHPVILEPIMKVEVTMPEEFMGDVIGDLNSRRGQIDGMESRGGTQVVRAFVPLALMFGYVTDLRSMSQGRASSSMEFSHYAEVPASVASELVQKSKF